MKRWWLVIVLLLSIGMNIGLLLGGAVRQRVWRDEAPSRDPSGVDLPLPGDERLPPFADRLTEELKLTGADRERFLEIQKTFFGEVSTARRQVVEHQAALRGELLSDDPRQERIASLLEASSRAHRALERAFVDNILQSRELLDVDQERRFFRFLERLRDRRRDGEQHFRRRRPRSEGQRPFGPPFSRQRAVPPPNAPRDHDQL